MNRICWLASYMKSGNTWLRVFINNLRSDSEQPVDINKLVREPIASAREEFDDLMGVESSDLTFEEIAEYRPQVYRKMACDGSLMKFLKIHDAYTVSQKGTHLVPQDVTHGAIYIMRNPCDIAVSLSHFYGMGVDVIIKNMGNVDAALQGSKHKLCSQLPQQILSWSRHVTSWVDQLSFPVHIVRYEDLLVNPEETFTAIARFAGLPDGADRIGRAIRNSSFDVLQQQEQINGFKERLGTAASFFRKGKAGDWRSVLSGIQVERIIEDHGAVMSRFGYLSADGKVLN